MYVELPEVGASVKKGETFGVIESVKVEDCVRHDLGHLGMGTPTLLNPPTGCNRLVFTYEWRGGGDKQRLGGRPRQGQHAAIRCLDYEGQGVGTCRGGGSAWVPGL